MANEVRLGLAPRDKARVEERVQQLSGSIQQMVTAKLLPFDALEQLEPFLQKYKGFCTAEIIAKRVKRPIQVAGASEGFKQLFRASETYKDTSLGFFPIAIFDGMLSSYFLKLQESPRAFRRKIEPLLFSAFTDEDLVDLFSALKRNVKSVRSSQPKAYETFTALIESVPISDRVLNAYRHVENGLDKKPTLCGVPLIELDRVLVSGKDSKSKGKTDDRTISDHNIERPAVSVVQDETSAQLDRLIPFLSDKGIKIDRIIRGVKPSNPKHPHYHVLVSDERNLQIAVAAGHLSYILREPMDFENKLISVEVLQDSEATYQSCSYDPKAPMVWMNSVFYFADQDRTILGVQNKRKLREWGTAALDLIKAFREEVSALKHLPARSDKIKSDNARLHGKTWNAALIASKRGNIQGLEGIVGVQDLFFHICRGDRSFEQSVSAEWWDNRNRREAQTLSDESFSLEDGQK